MKINKKNNKKIIYFHYFNKIKNGFLNIKNSIIKFDLFFLNKEYKKFFKLMVINIKIN